MQPHLSPYGHFRGGQGLRNQARQARIGQFTLEVMQIHGNQAYGPRGRAISKIESLEQLVNTQFEKLDTSDVRMAIVLNLRNSSQLKCKIVS